MLGRKARGRRGKRFLCGGCEPANSREIQRLVRDTKRWQSLGRGVAANAQQIGTGRGWARGCEVVRGPRAICSHKNKPPKSGLK